MKNNPLLLDFIQKLKDNKFKVYQSQATPQPAWIIFEDLNGNIGYCQENYFSGLDFSTIHKANRTTGTGFGVHKEVINPTVQHAKDALCIAPVWASTEDIKSVKKYKNMSDYLTNSGFGSLKYKEI